ncbi:MAG: hypothetical protein KDK65_05725, partial [Chlamydiia bacterium]|nr:hypothetical protein [Chlamydiia bacterium]
MKIFLMAFMISTALFGGSFDTIPNEFFVTERWFSFSTTFDIETKAQKLGTVHRRIFSLTTQYDFYDWEQNLITNSRMRFFSFGVVFDVTDASGETLGTVNEKIFNFFPTFEII